MEDKTQLILNRAGKVWEEMKEKKPLVYQITNFVAMPEQAHATLAIGASPVMALSPEESADMCNISNALLINIGTPTAEIQSAMEKAMDTANRKSIPILLDPVGYGATSFRNNLIENFLKKYKVTVIKGNAGEIMALAGETGAVRGVDSVVSETFELKEVVETLAKKYKAVVVATGGEDFLSNGNETLSIKGGSSMLTKITGSGCILGSVIASLLGTKEDPLISSIAGLISFKLCSERAEKKDKAVGSFRVHLFDELSLISGEDLASKGDIKICV